MATKKTPAAKSTRSKRATATTHKKKTPKKASPKKRPTKGQSGARSTSKKATGKPTGNRKKSAKQSAEPDQSTQANRVGDEVVTIDRRRSAECRRGNACEAVQAMERPKLERRKKVQRRRQIDPTTCERDYSLEEVEFMNALDDYKRKSGRMFPTCSEILEVIHSIGYVKLTSMELADRGGSQQPLAAHEDTKRAQSHPGQQESGDLAETESLDTVVVAQTLEMPGSISPNSA